jgi:hypothetical protein
MILDATDRDGKEYEIHVKTPSWPLAKYILTESPKFSGDTIDENKFNVFCDEILKECLIKWKYTGEKEFHKGTDGLSASVVAAIVRTLIQESRSIAEVRVRTEKNS